MSKNRQRYYKNITYRDCLYNHYMELAMNRVKWNGLPKSMPKYCPENWLSTQGQCVAFKLPETDELAILPVAYGSVKLDIYGNPREWRAYAVGDSVQAEVIRNTILNDENSVLIWNNGSRTGDSQYIESIVDKIVALDKTIDINILMQRTPVLYKATTKNNRLTIENTLKEYSDGKQFILTDENSAIADGIVAINLGIPFIGDKLSDQYETYHNRILRYLGIDFLPVQKQERMLTGEVSGNDNETVIRREIFMKYREEAVEKIKDVLGVSLTVEFMDVEDVAEGTDTSELSRASDAERESGDAGDGDRETGQ